MVARTSPEPGKSPAAPARIPGLDGLRAISIVMVLVSHLIGTRGMPDLHVPESLHLGELGVRVFFVISGCLITSLLLQEQAKHGRISIKDFYVRRVYRIFPAFYAFLAVVLVLEAMNVIALKSGDALAAATYTMNYHRDRAWWVGHLWSLSVEEQFYLIWPAVMAFAGARRGLIGAALAFAAAPVIRVATWVLWPEARMGIGETFPTIFDAIAVGCVLAGLRDWLGRSPRYLAALASPLFALVPVLAIAVSMIPKVSINLAIGQSILNVLIALYVDRCIRYPDTLSGRVLNWGPLVWVGGLSYSLYLWQQLFLCRHSDAWPNAFPVNIGLALVAAVLSYYLIEQPVLRLRTRRAAAKRARQAA